MKILLIGRIDYPSKKGGDSIQMNVYKNYLVDNGFIVHDITDYNNAIIYDYIHIFNYQRLFDIYYLINYLDIKYNKIVLHTIHQSSKYIEKVEPKIEVAKNFIRLLINKKYNRNVFFFTLKKMKYFHNYCLENCEKVHFLSCKERAWFEEDYNYKFPDKKVIIAPNGIEKKHNKIFDYSKRDIDVLIPSRIEPMKNIVPLLNALSNKQISITIVGSVNKYHPLYLIKFLFLLKKKKNLKYLGFVSKTKMQEIYNRSKIVLLVSFSEVYPLIELEAIASDCFLITTENSASDLCLKGIKGYKQINPNNLGVINSYIETFLLQKKTNSRNKQKIPTWENVCNLIFSKVY